MTERGLFLALRIAKSCGMWLMLVDGRGDHVARVLDVLEYGPTADPDLIVTVAVRFRLRGEDEATVADVVAGYGFSYVPPLAGLRFTRPTLGTPRRPIARA